MTAENRITAEKRIGCVPGLFKKLGEVLKARLPKRLISHANRALIVEETRAVEKETTPDGRKWI